MPTLEDIKKQLEDLNKVAAFLSRKEIKELPSIL